VIFPEREKYILNTILYQMLILRKLAAISKQVFVVPFDNRTEGSGTTITEVVPKGNKRIVGVIKQAVIVFVLLTNI
jgi:hypothetical protein